MNRKMGKTDFKLEVLFDAPCAFGIESSGVLVYMALLVTITTLRRE